MHIIFFVIISLEKGLTVSIKNKKVKKMYINKNNKSINTLIIKEYS